MVIKIKRRVLNNKDFPKCVKISLMIALLGFIDNKDRGQRIPARISSCRAT
jgi:hypothetical protein